MFPGIDRANPGSDPQPTDGFPRALGGCPGDLSTTPLTRAAVFLPPLTRDSGCLRASTADVRAAFSVQRGAAKGLLICRTDGAVGVCVNAHLAADPLATN